MACVRVEGNLQPVCGPATESGVHLPHKLSGGVVEAGCRRNEHDESTRHARAPWILARDLLARVCSGLSFDALLPP